ncbi:MAG TPA: SRPBCC family protein [Puia sp.]|nr:SRPBCC family protein [Puia sp.]
MKLIKFAFLGLVVFFLVLTALSLLFPSQLRVARVVNIAAPKEKVFAAVSDLRSWKDWNQFLRPNTLSNIRYSSPSAGKGATLEADELTIRETAADTAEGIQLHWNLRGGKEVDGGIQFGSSPNTDSLAVVWYFDLHFRWYPWEKLGIFVYDRKLGPIMEESLTGLKQFVEKSH